MLVQELHFSVLQRLQEVGSYKRQKFRSEEIDLALNKAMYRLLEKGIEDNFSSDQINLSHIVALVRKNRINEVIIPGTIDKLYEDNISNIYSNLPNDFYWLVNGRVEVITNPLNCSIAPTLATKGLTEYIHVVNFPRSTKANSPYYAGLNITSTTKNTLFPTQTGIVGGFNSPESLYVFVDLITNYNYQDNPTLIGTDLKVYWERYRDTYYPDSFIFVSNISLGTVNLFQLNDTTYTSTNTANTYNTYNRALINNLTSKEVKTRPVTIINEKQLYNSLNNNFYKTRSRQPIVCQTQDYFITYTDQSFIVTRFYYDYIRKPRTISLVLGQDCELSLTIHHKLVDIAVELLRLDIKDPSYQQTVQDTQIRTI